MKYVIAQMSHIMQEIFLNQLHILISKMEDRLFALLPYKKYRNSFNLISNTSKKQILNQINKMLLEFSDILNKEYKN